MRLHLFLALIVTIALPRLLYAQGNTDLFAVDVKLSASKLQIFPESLVQITDRAAYDNQPAFINEKQLAFSAADEKGNHDIIIYNFESKKFTNLTKTNDKSEYSPSLTDCGLYVSAVTVEEDGKQRLWLYPTNFGEPELLYDDIEPVGYYDWYDNRAAMFVLGSPNTLVYPYSKANVLTIAQNIGRTIKRRPKTSIITYIDKNASQALEGGTAYAIRGFDIEKRTYLDFGYTLPGSEDFIWLNKNTLLMGRGEQLYIRSSKQQEWQLVGRLSVPGYSEISRLAYSPKLKQLVLVMNRSER